MTEKKECLWHGSILDYTSPFRFGEEQDLSKRYPFSCAFNHNRKK